MDVLCQFFPKTSVMTLYEYLSQLRALDSPELLTDKDTQKFSEFLRNTRVVACNAPGGQPHQIERLPEYSLEYHQRQVLEQVQQSLLVKNQVHNVLIKGLTTFSPFGVFTSFNTVRNHLLNHSWGLLLERVGDAAVRQLLLRCCVFVDVNNGSLLQVSGKALFDAKPEIGPSCNAFLPNRSLECSAILYAKREGDAIGRYRLQKWHILNSQKIDPLHLLCNIFCVSSLRKRQKLNQTMKRILPLLKSLISRHRKTNYKSLLDKACPLLEVSKVAGQSASVAQSHLLQQFTKPDNVCKFLRQVLLRIVPNKFWGSKRNFECICRAMHHFVNLRRFEVIDIHNMVQGYQLSDCSWISNKGGKSAAIANQKLIFHLFRWLFIDYFVPVLRCFFYATETEPYRNRILFYRLEVWSRIEKIAMDALCDSQLRPLPSTSRSLLGFSRLRILPKSNGIRPIVNCSYKHVHTTTWGKKSSSVNGALKIPLSTLNFECQADPLTTGCSSVGYDSVHIRLLPFIEGLRKIIISGGTVPKVYMVATDITRCFDSIQRAKVMDIVQRVLKESDYFVHKWVTMLATHSNGSSKMVRKQFQREALPAELLPQIDQFAKKLSKNKNIVYNEIASVDMFSRSDIIEIIKDHIYNTTVEFNGQVFQQTCGIPQGSVLSSLLCSLYLADLEKQQLRPQMGFADQDWMWSDSLSSGILLRHVDDFLLLTTSKSSAEAFLFSMERGFTEYQCAINTSKTRTNFLPDLKTNTVNHIVPWCGLLFDSQRLVSLRSDYSKFVSTPHISDALSFRRTTGKQCAKFLELFLRHFVQVKTHPLLLDPRINPKHIVALNVHQIFQFAALKLYSWLAQLGKRVNLTFADTAFQNLLVVFHQIRKRRCSNCPFTLSLNEVKWLALRAFKQVLLRKQTRFRPVIEKINSALRRPHLRRLNNTAFLRFALLQKHHRQLRNVIY
uniref:Telomerase reverse transcriptase n=1 Tax=Spongospora subterranea TaxID=70186 RepID=A0A0H5RFS0_9EUKA|eukprot:CRZ07499.1 hypothetical protein [Spongospora subterranea]